MLILDSMDHDLNPFTDWATIVDCGDISNTPFDKLIAIHELEKGMKAMNERKPKNDSVVDATRFITIGGDHTISIKSPKVVIRMHLILLQHFQSSVPSTLPGAKSLCYTSIPTSTHGTPYSSVVD